MGQVHLPIALDFSTFYSCSYQSINLGGIFLVMDKRWRQFVIEELGCILQALAAASKSVDPSLLVHSLHSYFLRTGDDQGIVA